MSLKKEAQKMATRLGADFFGVVSADAFDDAPSGHRPKDVLPSAKSIIVIGMKMLDAQTDLLPVEGERCEASRARYEVLGCIVL
jgi:epoxyqueuosine reductase QueG